MNIPLLQRQQTEIGENKSFAGARARTRRRLTEARSKRYRRRFSLSFYSHKFDAQQNLISNFFRPTHRDEAYSLRMGMSALLCQFIFLSLCLHLSLIVPPASASVVVDAIIEISLRSLSESISDVMLTLLCHSHSPARLASPAAPTAASETQRHFYVFAERTTPLVSRTTVINGMTNDTSSK